MTTYLIIKLLLKEGRFNNEIVCLISYRKIDFLLSQLVYAKCFTNPLF